MFDEEVSFYLEDKNVKNFELEKSLGRLGKTVAAIGGGIGGYFAVKHSLDFNSLWSFMVGFPLGVAVALPITKVIGALKNPRLENRVETEDLGEETNDLDTNSVYFEYRGNKVKCILNLEDEKGHIFYMHIDDEAIIDPAFSYQPKRQKSLGFKFSIPRYENKSDGFATAFLGGIRRFSREVAKEGEEWKETDDTDNKVEKPFHLKLADELSKAVAVDKYKLSFEMDSQKIHVYLGYEGKDYSQQLGNFSQMASKAMNFASGFKRREKFKQEVV